MADGDAVGNLISIATTHSANNPSVFSRLYFSVASRLLQLCLPRVYALRPGLARSLGLMRRCCAKRKSKNRKRLAHTAPLLASCHPQEAPFSPFHRLRPFVPLSREVKKQTAEDGRKGKTMDQRGRQRLVTRFSVTPTGVRGATGL